MGDSKTDTTAEAFLADWHRIVAARDLPALRDVLAEDVTMGAPPYWQKMEGSDIVHHLLGVIINTIEGFTYHREWTGMNNPNEIALEFTGKIGKRDLQGVDLITLNDEGKLQNLDVMIRPENAIAPLREVVTPQMMAFIQAKGQGKA